MQKLVIDRQRWLRGEGGNKSSLLRGDDGKMCCLGFHCINNGLSPTALLNVTSPMELGISGYEEVPRFLLELINLREDRQDSVDNEICNHLMNVNDAQLDKSAVVSDESDRERQIKRLFEDIGVEVEFIN